MQSNRMNAKYYLNTLVRFSSFQKCDIQVALLVLMETDFYF